MKKENLIFRFSLILNMILIIAFMIIGYKFRSKIYDKIATQSSYKIIMFGDGFTSGGKWEKDLNRVDIKNSGIGGSTTSHFVWTLNDLVINYNPKICFIEGGINDIGVGIPLNRTFMNYQSIVDSLLKHQIVPVLQSAFYSNYPNASESSLKKSRVDSLNLYLSTLAIKKGITYIDLDQNLSENGKLKKELTKDVYRINELGYKIWAREVDKILNTKGI